MVIKPESNQRGSALILAIIAVIVIFAMILVAVEGSRGETYGSRFVADRAVALYSEHGGIYACSNDLSSDQRGDSDPSDAGDIEGIVGNTASPYTTLSGLSDSDSDVSWLLWRYSPCKFVSWPSDAGSDVSRLLPRYSVCNFVN